MNIIEGALPRLAGICTQEEAERRGFSVEENVLLLKRYHYSLKRLHQLVLAWICPTEEYELKSAFSYHAFLFSENVSALRKRISEMREPPLGLDDVPDKDLEIFFDEILCSKGALEFVGGAYRVALPSLLEAVTWHLETTNPLVDHASVRILRQLERDLAEIANWTDAAVPGLERIRKERIPEDRIRSQQDLLHGAGGIHGREKRPSTAPVPKYSISEYRYNPEPQRDARFTDPFNCAVNAEDFISNPEMPPHAKNLMLLIKRIREIDVPEYISSIIIETRDKPWEYYADMTRQNWDEARHGMMGEAWFEKYKIDWTQSRVRHAWAHGLNTLLTARERHAILYMGEQGLMAKTGKRFEWETAQEAGDLLSATYHDYDWADEVLHTQIGRKWFVTEYSSTSEAKTAGENAISKYFKGKPNYVALGLTQEENWWPSFYRHACEAMKLPTEESALAYDKPEWNSDGRPKSP